LEVVGKSEGNAEGNEEGKVLRLGALLLVTEGV
jgi:hypothetical protein